MNYSYILADVFTSEPFGGNPLAVFPHAEGLTTLDMQRIARELNLSETAFVSAPNAGAATHAVRIFTPGKELPFAGHPTIGTAIVIADLKGRELATQPLELVFEEGVGNIPVTVTQLEDHTYFAALKTRAATVNHDVPANDALGRLLGLPAEAVRADRLKPAAVSCGVPFTMIPLANRDHLAACSLNLDVWREILAGCDAAQVYPFVVDPDRREVHVRMFAPAFGQPEDAATGAAAAALGSFLSQSYDLRNISEWRIHQGAYMGRKSVLSVKVVPSLQGVGAVELGGSALIIGEGKIYGYRLAGLHESRDEGMCHA
jgi:trans-2,3-dihydro-3-hydroxyanthranilate isomerase